MILFVAAATAVWWGLDRLEPRAEWLRVEGPRRAVAGQRVPMFVLDKVADLAWHGLTLVQALKLGCAAMVLQGVAGHAAGRPCTHCVTFAPDRPAHCWGAFAGEAALGSRICRSTADALSVWAPRFKVNSSRVPGGPSQKRLSGRIVGSVRHLVTSRSASFR